MRNTEEELSSKDGKLHMITRRFLFSLPASEQGRVRPFYDSSWCHNAFILCLAHFTCTHPSPFYPNLQSYSPSPHHIHTVSLWPTASIRASQTDRQTERTGLICTDRRKCSLTFSDNLNGEMLQAYSKFMEMYTRKVIFVWNDLEFMIEKWL